MAFMIVVTPAMASCAPGERLAMVLSSLALAASHCFAILAASTPWGRRASFECQKRVKFDTEFKKVGDEFLFLERVGNWLEEILGKKVTVSVSE